MEERLKQVMASVFGVDAASISDDSSPDTLEEWDSLKHVLLVIALEREFRITFAPKEILALQNYRHIRAVLQDKTGA